MSASSRDEAIDVAAGIILFRRRRDGPEFLLLRNARHRSWGFPKGHAEPGEDALSTARRETLEETGITAVELVAGFEETIEYVLRDRRRRKRVVYFLGATADDAVRSPEHDQMEWLPPDDVLAVLTHQSLRAVFEAALARIGRI